MNERSSFRSTLVTVHDAPDRVLNNCTHAYLSKAYTITHVNDSMATERHVDAI